MANKKTSKKKAEPLLSACKDRFGLILTYIGSFMLYWSTDLTTASSIRHYPSGRMVHPVVVVHEWLLVLGIWVIAAGFFFEFSKGLSVEGKLYVILFAIWPLLLLTLTF